MLLVTNVRALAEYNNESAIASTSATFLLPLGHPARSKSNLARKLQCYALAETCLWAAWRPVPKQEDQQTKLQAPIGRVQAGMDRSINGKPSNRELRNGGSQSDVDRSITETFQPQAPTEGFQSDTGLRKASISVILSVLFLDRFQEPIRSS